MLLKILFLGALFVWLIIFALSFLPETLGNIVSAILMVVYMLTAAYVMIDANPKI